MTAVQAGKPAPPGHANGAGDGPRQPGGARFRRDSYLIALLAIRLENVPRLAVQLRLRLELTRYRPLIGRKNV